MGRATTAIAARKLERAFIGAELLPKYWTMAAERSEEAFWKYIRDHVAPPA
jgi:DNA modification methylase